MLEYNQRVDRANAGFVVRDFYTFRLSDLEIDRIHPLYDSIKRIFPADRTGARDPNPIIYSANVGVKNLKIIKNAK